MDSNVFSYYINRSIFFFFGKDFYNIHPDKKDLTVSERSEVEKQNKK